MNFGGRMYLEKLCMVRHDQETKLMNIVFENEGHELDLVLKSELLKELRNRIIEFQDHETNVEGFEEGLSRKCGEHGNNSEGFFEVYVEADLEKCSIDMKTELDAEGAFPVWLSVGNSHGRRLLLSLNVDQARQIKEMLEKFIAAEEAFSRIKKKSCNRERAV